MGSILIATMAILLGTSALHAQGSGPVALAWEEVLEGRDEAEIDWPVAIAAASAEDILVADGRGARLVRFRVGERGWETEVTELPQAPLALAWDGRRYLASLRGEGGLVALEGTPLRRRPIPLPAGVVPGAVTVLATGEILVADLATESLVVLSDTGRLLRRQPVESRPSNLAPTAGGGFYAAFAVAGEIRRYGAGGEQTGAWKVPGIDPTPAWPVAVIAETGGQAMVLDRHNHRILILESDGRVAGTGSRRGWEPGLLLLPAAMTALPDGRVAVADQGNGRVQVFRRVD